MIDLAETLRLHILLSVNQLLWQRIREPVKQHISNHLAITCITKKESLPDHNNADKTLPLHRIRARKNYWLRHYSYLTQQTNP